MVRFSRRRALAWYPCTFAMATAAASTYAGVPLTVQSIRISDMPPATNPIGAPVFLILDVTASLSTGSTGSSREIADSVCREVSQRVEVDGEMYLNRLPSGCTNDVAKFWAIQNPVTGDFCSATAANAVSATCAALFYLKIEYDEERVRASCFSEREGKHKLVFAAGEASALIDIDIARLEGHPDAAGDLCAEDVIVPALQLLDHDGGRCSDEWLARVQDLTAKYGDSQVAPFLRWLLAAGRWSQADGRAFRQPQVGKSGLELQKECDLEMAALSGEVQLVSEAANSPFLKTLADWYLGEAELLQAKWADSVASREEHLERFMTYRASTDSRILPRNFQSGQSPADHVEFARRVFDAARAQSLSTPPPDRNPKEKRE